MTMVTSMVLTVVGKLALNDADKQRLEETRTKFVRACNYISQVAFERKCFNPVALHHKGLRQEAVGFSRQRNAAQPQRQPQPFA